jgi:GAF domain-containing protein
MKDDGGLEFLVDVIQELSLTRTLDTVMQIVRTAARRLTGADGATFVLRDGDQCHYAEEDAIAPLWKGRRFPLSACISGWVMLNRQPAVIPDIYADPRIPAEAYRPTFVKSLVMVPIRTIAPLGAIGNYWADCRQPSDHEVRLLQTLADSTAVALENVQVYQELEQRVQKRTAELQEANNELRLALERIQRLEKMVRMCAWTKRLELDGEWVDIETYLKRRFGLSVTHAISDEAKAEQLRDLARFSDLLGHDKGNCP